MTLRTHLVLTALLASSSAGPALAAAGSSSGGVTARIAAPAAASIGRATPVSCVAADSAGIRDVALEAAGPDGARVAIAVGDRVDLGGGSVQVEGAWVPGKIGAHVVRCVASGMSSVTASGTSLASVYVSSPLYPIVSSVAAADAVVLPGKAVELRAVAADPEGGALRYGWTAAAGAVAPRGEVAVWTAPVTEGTYTIQVAVTDDTGLVTRKSVAVEVSPAVFQGSSAVQLRGPRRVAASDDGSFWVVDADQKLSKLTKRGDLIGTAQTGVRSVAVGGGIVFAGTEGGEVVKVDAAAGRIVGRIDLGVSSGPVGIAWDGTREVLWLAYGSGLLESRRADGTVLLRITKTSVGSLVRVVDVAVDSAAGIVWVAQDRNAVGGMIFGFNVLDGSQVRVIGADGSGPVKVAGALTVGAGGQLFVSDAFAGQVAVVNPSGATVRKIGRPGRGTGGMVRPAGMAFMANGDLLVANMDASRLDRFGSETALPSCEGDSDCDGLSDAAEVAAGLDPNRASDAFADADGDGLNNTEELQRGTNVQVADSDGDGFVDGAEVAAGFDPMDGGDHTAKLTATGGVADGPGLVRLTASVGGLPVEVACVPAWRQVAGPAVELKDAATLAPSFVARKAGAYRFAVEATCDGVAAVGAIADVAINNVAPLADAGRVVVVPAGSGRVQLSAGASSDANADTTRFAWEQVTGAAVSGPVTGKVLTAKFGSAGVYEFAMTALDSVGASSSAVAQVVATGSSPIPVASVAGPVTAVETQPVTLDASGSIAAADAVFSWQQVAGAPVALVGQGSARPSFAAPAAGRYAFQVVVQQGRVKSLPAVVEVFVAPVGGALPVAVAAAPAVVDAGGVVVLDGSASTGAGSLSFGWKQVAGPAAGLRSAGSAKAEAFVFEAGSYVFELAVADGAAVSMPARVRIEVRAGGKPLPVARANVQATAVVGERVVLDGSASQGARNFRWTQVAGPWAVVQGGASAAFIAPAAGLYGFELEVDDGQVRGAPVRVDVVVSQNGMEN